MGLKAEKLGLNEVNKGSYLTKFVTVFLCD
jgi:hypothetical protein